ncbi:large ribosomal subunit protein bL17 [Lepeophtheirus salmonis]|uniref:Large ribosomal subunit protein bL17m n=1 Tax=Lepeophtheirus salmonis TaxID=72036 RepID=C1BVL6_LEPSM|nr:50S ribosomal protein L17-like [Lepeophtheirus salmonis]ACO13069.1 39S ribosomal protein L17, mitochondrial precursor [Lepeophtheirus salmonis]
MNQAEVGRLVRTLGVKLIAPKRIKNPLGYRGTLDKVRESVTDLIVDERIHLRTPRAQLTRLYAERLISEAIMNGDCHKETMRIASWWLESHPSAVHKLFQVLVPRFGDSEKVESFTRIFKAPMREEYNPNKKYSGAHIFGHSVVELKKNPFPPLAYSNSRPNKKHIHNVLLSEAKKEYFKDSKVKNTDDD